jgi:antitoxin component of RelBE/YafQ-DinJ toxin-antitoxin module
MDIGPRPINGMIIGMVDVTDVGRMHAWRILDEGELPMDRREQEQVIIGMYENMLTDARAELAQEVETVGRLEDEVAYLEGVIGDLIARTYLGKKEEDFPPPAAEAPLESLTMSDRIEELMFDGEYRTPGQVSDALGANPGTVSSRMSQMKASGVLTYRRGKGYVIAGERA